MDSNEQALFSDVVTIVNRSKKPLEFVWAGAVYLFKGKEEKHLPRHIAMHGVKAKNIKVSASNGIILESFFGIKEDKKYPCTPITDLDPEVVKHLEKVEGADKVFVEGKLVTKKVFDINTKEFS